MKPVYAARHYTPCDDLWVITTYYNPAHYNIKRQNYERFAKPILEAGLKLVTVECAFGQENFELAPAANIIQVRSRDVMWQKEGLINLAIQQLPPEANKVVWIDNDILFCNPEWAVQTAAQLDHYPVVQPCDSLHRLDRNKTAYAGVGYFRRSFAYQWQHRPELAFVRGGDHGFPGAVWAAQRSVIEKHGLYDAHILGSNDELFAHATNGGVASRCIKFITTHRLRRQPRIVDQLLRRLMRIPWPRSLANWYLAHLPPPSTSTVQEQFFAHYLDWAQSFYADVRGHIGCVPGMTIHLWHGQPDNRQYGSREAILKLHNFNPLTDLQLNEYGVWEWNSDKPQMHQAVNTYFNSRREDG